MIIHKYGIQLERVTHADIEMIRQARNRDDIRSKMLDQRIITPEQQEAWFTSINNANNYYFVVHSQGKKVGLASGKNIDWEKRESEGGLFIWEPSLIGTPLPAIVSILMMELTFDLVNLQKTFARVHPSNHQARQYHLSMGYTPLPDGKHLVLTKLTHNSQISRLRRLAAAGHLVPPLSTEDIAFPDMAYKTPLYKDLPEDILKSFGLK